MQYSFQQVFMRMRYLLLLIYYRPKTIFLDGESGASADVLLRHTRVGGGKRMKPVWF
jgi:hypothetical protein